MAEVDGSGGAVGGIALGFVVDFGGGEGKEGVDEVGEGAHC